MRAEMRVDVHLTRPSLMLTFDQNMGLQTNFKKFSTSNVGKEIPAVQIFFLDYRYKEGYRR
jgi:hypothetical protein